jgi:hypothetical protein
VAGAERWPGRSGWWLGRGGRGGASGAVAERAVVGAERCDGGAVKWPATATLPAGAPRACSVVVAFLLSVQWGRRGRGAGFYTPPLLSPDWWLQPGLKTLTFSPD